MQLQRQKIPLTVQATRKVDNMQFFAALVEHLIVGILALVWILPVAHFFGIIPLLPPTEKWSDYKEVLIAVGLPAAYVAGMFVDVFASMATQRLRNFAKRRFGAASGTSYKNTIRIIKPSADESARYLLQLTAREKIARGAALNFLIGAFVNFALPKSTYSIPGWLLIALCVLGTFVWMRLYGLVDRFKAHW
ncbi:hypothetical protein ACL58G_22320 [Massilia sp. GER05]|uniref:hypothetical protein n=1 Tax=unclassified Massilia TaxID=2609279 RepID=UPI0039B05D60